MKRFFRRAGSPTLARWYTSIVMSSTSREQGVHGPRSAPMSLHCVLLAPRGVDVPAELIRSLDARSTAVFETTTEYEALAALLRSDADSTSTDVLLLIEPDRHADRCVELARAVQIYAPTVRIWRHQKDASPSLASYILPAEPTEAEQVQAVRTSLRAGESPYDRASRESAPPSLRLVVDDDSHDPAPETGSDPDHATTDSDGLLSADEIEMLMDPLFEAKPRRGGDSR